MVHTQHAHLYQRYHEWRQNYDISTDIRDPSQDLCDLAAHNAGVCMLTYASTTLPVYACYPWLHVFM